MYIQNEGSWASFSRAGRSIGALWKFYQGNPVLYTLIQVLTIARVLATAEIIVQLTTTNCFAIIDRFIATDLNSLLSIVNLVQNALEFLFPAFFSCVNAQQVQVRNCSTHIPEMGQNTKKMQSKK